MITVNNLIKTFTIGSQQYPVLRGISFSVKTGEFLSINGKSGSGKSTLLYQLSLLDTPNEGNICIDDVDTDALNPIDRTHFRLFHLGYVFQDYALIPTLTATENVCMPLLMQGFREDVVVKRAIAALERVGLQDRLNYLPSKLSGGQQQRVSIARAIAHEPKIIFADEPTANLDSESSLKVLDIFLELHRAGQTVVMVTHEDEYAAMADRTITLLDGKIIGDKKSRKK